VTKILTIGFHVETVDRDCVEDACEELSKMLNEDKMKGISGL